MDEPIELMEENILREITAHVMEFIGWLLKETNYPLIFDELNDKNTEKHYKHWLDNVKNK